MNSDGGCWNVKKVHQNVRGCTAASLQQEIHNSLKGFHLIIFIRVKWVQTNIIICHCE